MGWDGESSLRIFRDSVAVCQYVAPSVCSQSWSRAQSDLLDVACYNRAVGHPARGQFSFPMGFLNTQPNPILPVALQRR